jgi:hypothetical protein
MDVSTSAERIEARLVELRTELGEGERALRELDSRRERLVSSMLRIGGAIQVLEELLAAPSELPASRPNEVESAAAEA